MELTDQAKELLSAYEAAKNGYMLPLGVLGAAWLVIISLLISIYKRDRKESDQRHKETREILKALTENTHELTTLVKVQEVRIDNIEHKTAS
jgi:hypothetical protein